MFTFWSATATPGDAALNQDRARVLSHGDSWIVLMADGAGGTTGGARAAELIVDGASSALSAQALDIRDPRGWRDLLGDLDQVVASDSVAGESTAVCLAIGDYGVVGASCGDSRAIMIRDDGAIDLTRHQTRRPRLGSGLAEVRSFVAPTLRDILVATDGLFDNASMAEILESIASGKADPAYAAIEVVRRRYRTLPDDITVVVGMHASRR
jgi:serine/threonine protein phosphatase PrpC